MEQQKYGKPAQGKSSQGGMGKKSDKQRNSEQTFGSNKSNKTNQDYRR